MNLEHRKISVPRLIEILDGRPAGLGRWRARCPVHGGNSRRSLSISQGDGGRLLLFCFGGCRVDEICRQIGITVADLFPDHAYVEPPEVRNAKHALRDLRLTPRERERPITIIEANEQTFDDAARRALLLSVEGEIVQVVLTGDSA